MGSHCISRLVSFARQRYAGESAERSDGGVKASIVKRLGRRKRRNLVDGRPDLYETRSQLVCGGGADGLDPMPEDYEYKLTDADGNEIAMTLLWVGLPERSARSVPE
jgi:hypothetical protein